MAVDEGAAVVETGDKGLKKGAIGCSSPTSR